MSYDSARIALYTVLNSNIDQALIGLRFDTIMEEDPITDGSMPWIRAVLEPFETFQKSIGSSTPLDSTLGFLNCEIYDREENGFAEIFRIADTLKQLFMGKRFDSGKIIIDRVSLLTRPAYHSWNSKLVQINYISNEQSTR